MSKAKVWCWNKTFGIVQKVTWCRQEQVDVTQKKYFMSTKKKDAAQKSISFHFKMKVFWAQKKLYFPEQCATVYSYCLQ